MNKKKNIAEKYKEKGLISDRAFERLNKDIEEELMKNIKASKKKIKQLKRILYEGKLLYT